jgi:uncharacterized protein (DUF1697 family)
MARFVALLRGINVGTAKAVSMPALVEVFESLGYTDVVTVLRSGNVVFTGGRQDAGAAASIERRLLERTGVASSALVFGAERFAGIAAANPLVDVATDGSKLFVTFLASPPPKNLEAPDDAALAPEMLRIGPHAIYQWMPNGSQSTKVPRAFWKQFAGAVTARNANTVDKLVALLE